MDPHSFNEISPVRTMVGRFGSMSELRMPVILRFRGTSGWQTWMSGYETEALCEPVDQHRTLRSPLGIQPWEVMHASAAGGLSPQSLLLANDYGYPVPRPSCRL